MIRRFATGRRVFILSLAFVSCPLLRTFAGASDEAILPPEMRWEGASRQVALPGDHRWVTPSEKVDFRTTPSYDETVAWLRKLVDGSPLLRMTSLGKSPEGRDIWMVIASKGREFDPARLAKSGKPTVLVQAGIHAGEIDGKDAGLMLLRDMTVVGTQKSLLDKVNLLFIPIFNVDGHEHSSRYGRINQRGPEVLGWRTTARNLNLNRDYTKIDTEEMHALIAALARWRPDLYIDIHVTDGIDYQYDVTYGYNGMQGWSPSIVRWLDARLTPAANESLRRMGHVPGPLIFAVDDSDLSKGIYAWIAGPRFSNGYGDARHLPTILVENHSLKPYGRRVLGTYVFVASVLDTVGRFGGELRAAIKEDRERHPAEIPLDFTVPETAPDLIDFLGVRSETRLSEISGGLQVIWTGEPVAVRVPRIAATTPSVTVRRPAAYWIPAAWTDVIERLKLHGIEMERIPGAREVEVEIYRLQDPAFEDDAFEGHVRVSATASPEKKHMTFPAGSYRISTDQVLGDLAVLLLEPGSPDSFFQWGFFDAALARTEYVEAYVMEPMARRMLEENPTLAEEFEKRLTADESFRASSSARLQWFYDRTPYRDERWRVYPVARELDSTGNP